MRKTYTNKKFKRYNKSNKTKKRKIVQSKKRKSTNHRNHSTIRNVAPRVRKYARATRVLKGFGAKRKDIDKEKQKKEILIQSIPNAAPASLLRAFVRHPVEKLEQMSNDDLRKVYVDWRLVESARRRVSRDNKNNNIATPILPKKTSSRRSQPKRSRDESNNTPSSPFKKKAMNVKSSVDEPTALKLFTNEGNINDMDATYDELASTQPTGYTNSLPNKQNMDINFDEEDDLLDPFDMDDVDNYDTK